MRCMGLRRYLGKRSGGAMWNDSRGRTAAEVSEAMRQAATATNRL